MICLPGEGDARITPGVQAFAMVPVGALRDPTLNPMAKCVLGVLCDFAGDKYYCWPSDQAIADALGLKSDRTVRYALKDLEDRGWITREKRKGTNQRSIIRLNWVRLSRNHDTASNCRQGPNVPEPNCRVPGKTAAGMCRDLAGELDPKNQTQEREGSLRSHPQEERDQEDEISPESMARIEEWLKRPRGDPLRTSAERRLAALRAKTGP